MFKHTMLIGGMITVLGFAGFLLCLPFAVKNVNQIVTSYREEFNKTELFYETTTENVNQIRFFGNVNVRLRQSEDDKVRVYRVSKRMPDDSLRILRTQDAERSYLNITGNTEKYGGTGLLDRVFSLMNDQTFEEITVYIPKTVEINASGLGGDLFGLLQVEYLNSYTGALVEPEGYLTLEEIRQNHLAIEQSMSQYEYDLETLGQRYVQGQTDQESYREGVQEQTGNIAYELEKVVRMLAAHYQLTEQHVTLIMDSVRAYIDCKYQYKDVLLRRQIARQELEDQAVAEETYAEEQEALDTEEQDALLALEEAQAKLARYESIYLEGFDLIA